MQRYSCVRRIGAAVGGCFDGHGRFADRTGSKSERRSGAVTPRWKAITNQCRTPERHYRETEDFFAVLSPSQPFDAIAHMHIANAHHLDDTTPEVTEHHNRDAHANRCKQGCHNRCHLFVAGEPTLDTTGQERGDCNGERQQWHMDRRIPPDAVEFLPCLGDRRQRDAMDLSDGVEQFRLALAAAPTLRSHLSSEVDIVCPAMKLVPVSAMLSLADWSAS